MLTVTKALREHMVKNFSLDQESDDDAVRKSVSDLVISGKFDPTKLAELTTPEPSKAQEAIRSMIKEEVGGAFKDIKSLIEGGAKGGDGGSETDPNPDGQKGNPDPNNPTDTTTTKEAPVGDFQKAYAAAAMSGDIDNPMQVRVKSVVERFNDSRTAATFDKSNCGYIQKNFGGVPVTNHMQGPGAHSFDMPTDRSKAIAGAWFKHLVGKTCREAGRPVPRQFKMSEMDQELVLYAVHECKFVGPIGYQGGDDDSTQADFWCDGEKVYDGHWRKALLDDSTSGGLEAVPIEFDANFILTPLLHSELFPLVDITNVTRRRIEASKIGNPTLSWGASEGTGIGLFNTDSFISAFDNTIYPVSGALELGRDFMSDSPLDIGGIIVNRYGQAFRKEMDDVIANGNGTNRPEGIFQTSGVTTVSSAGGAGAAPQVGDYEGLRFGVGKEFRAEAGTRAVYVGTDTSYSRARGIPVDSSNDARRIFGIADQEDYTVFRRRFAVNESITNAQIAYACLNRYRLYRRQGIEVRIIREDSVLARKNTELVVIRARFGGAMDHASAMAKITDGQA